MSVEFIGYIATRESSEIIPATGPVIDLAHIEAVARTHDDGGCDLAVVAVRSTSPASTLSTAQAASVTSKLNVMIAHRPGFTQPTLAARQFATLDQLTRGRVGVH